MKTVDKLTPEKSKAQSQLDKFVDAARDLECDEDEAAFEAKLKKLAKTEKANGHWRVDFAKVGAGHVANYYPSDGEVGHPSSPILATPQEVHAWLLTQGKRQSEDDADIWFN